MDKIKSHRIWWIVLIPVIIVIGVGIGWIVKTSHSDKPIQIIHGTVLPIPHKIKSFQLIDENGKRFTNSHLKGHWSLLFFGFTHCPMMCPTTLGELNKAYLQLKKQGLEENLPHVIFISVDPARDTLAVIKKYVKKFNANFTGVTGTKKQIKKFTKQLGIAYAKVTKSGEADYLMNHSGSILVINSEGKWRAVLRFPHKANIIVEDFKRLIKVGNSS